MTVKTILATLLISTALLSQQVKGQQPSANKDELKEKAFAVLVSLAGEVNTLQSGENRARLGSNIAGSVWPNDEQRARSLFIMVQSDIKNALQDPPGDDPRDILTFMVFMKLRVETVERIAKHDPLLALEFLQNTKPNWTGPSAIIAEDVRRSETRLATKLSSKHSELALQLGREVLARGFSQDLLDILSRLNPKQDVARVFYQEIVSKLRRVGIFGNWGNLEFVKNLGLYYRPPRVDPATYRELITLLKSSAAKYDCARANRDDGMLSYFCGEMARIIPTMERIERDSQKAQGSIQQNPESEEFGSVGIYVDDTLTPEEILATVADNPGNKFGLYNRAVSVAAKHGDFEQAQIIIEEFNGSVAEKERLKQMVERYRESMTLSEEGLAQVRARLKQTDKPVERARILIYLANRAGFTDRERALKFLDEARGIAEAMKPGKDQAEVLIQLARGYCLEKNHRGFEIVESLLPKLNELISAAMKLDGYDAISVRDGEWNMSANGSVGDLLTKLAQNAPHFAWVNFDRALNMTKQFERPEIRMMAQLKLAQGILNGKQKRFDRT